jgi:CheY-like chemotaxis protein/signal transduction histidine kinase
MKNPFPQSSCIVCDSDGSIIDNKQQIIALGNAASIQEVHPFFETIVMDDYQNQQKQTFNGVHIQEKVVDITIEPLADYHLKITLQDETAIYQRIQSIAQHKNESLIFNEVLQLKNELLQEREDFRREFLNNISYELRNPLTVIKAFTSMLLKSDLDFQQEQLLTAIENQGSSMQNLVQDMVDLSSFKSYTKDLESKPFSFHELTRASFETFRTQLRLLQGSAAFTIDENVQEMIYGDQKRLQQALHYIYRDVLHSINEHGIEVRVLQTQIKAAKASLRIQITQIADSSSNESDGLEPTKEDLGYGLSLANEILLAMKGSLTVKTNSAGQKEYVARLKAPVSRDSRISKKTAPVNNRALNLKDRIKTIVFEKESTAQLAAIKILTSTGNFDTTVYTDAGKLLEILQKEDTEVDLILISSSINALDAMELLKMIKTEKHASHRGLRYIALSMTSEESIIREYRKTGYHDVIVKPYSDDELTETIYNSVNLKKFK